MPRICIVLLAAGASSRMGSSKPLLKWGNETLIENRIATFKKTRCPFLVVLGSNAENILPLLQEHKEAILVFENWTEGMSSSIAFAIQQLLVSNKQLDGVLLTTIDQPLVDIQHLNNLITAFKPGEKQILVSEAANGWKGIPVLFDAFYFEELATISGDVGAKAIVKKHTKYVQSFIAGNKLTDMDTPKKYQELFSANLQ